MHSLSILEWSVQVELIRFYDYLFPVKHGMWNNIWKKTSYNGERDLENLDDLSIWNKWFMMSNFGYPIHLLWLSVGNCINYQENWNKEFLVLLENPWKLAFWNWLKHSTLRIIYDLKLQSVSQHNSFYVEKFSLTNCMLNESQLIGNVNLNSKDSRFKLVFR